MAGASDGTAPVKNVEIRRIGEIDINAGEQNANWIQSRRKEIVTHVEVGHPAVAPEVVPWAREGAPNTPPPPGPPETATRTEVRERARQYRQMSRRIRLLEVEAQADVRLERNTKRKRRNKRKRPLFTENRKLRKWAKWL